jgi:hypothetical protein
MDSDIEETPTSLPEGIPPANNWFETQRAVANSRVVIPNALARSSVFSSMPTHIARKEYTEPATLASLKNVTIQQLGGSQLTQTEATVWLILVRRALRLPMPKTEAGSTKMKIEFASSELLHELGMLVDTQHRNALRKSILLLSGAKFDLLLPKFQYVGNLLDVESGLKKGDKRICISIDLAISGVFAEGWSYLNLEHRRALHKDPLAQWLFSYYSTHANPYPSTEVLLKTLAGREIMRQDKWLAALSGALAELHSVTGWICELADKRMVNVDKTPSRKVAVQAPAVVIPKALELPALEVAAAPPTRPRDARATDEQLLEGWLQGMSRNKLLQELMWLGLSPSKYGQETMQAPELRSHLYLVIKAWPHRLESQIAKLRAREFL